MANEATKRMDAAFWLGDETSVSFFKIFDSIFGSRGSQSQNGTVNV
ncbi:MAG: hypothetical protein GY826_10560 [Fuerstiella sp.]|nr:hypothetical protein [Fuerstiella sp.]